MTSLEEKTVQQICEYLQEKGCPESVLRSFRGRFCSFHQFALNLSCPPFIVLYNYIKQELDGNAVLLGLATLPGPDWLKEVVAPLGLRLKVHQYLRTLCGDYQVS